MSQPEARLGRQIKAAVLERGGWGFKVHGGPTMMVGLPDLIFCYRGQFVAMEVKMPEGVVSNIQRRRIKEIRDAGGHAYVVRSVASAVRVLARVDAALDGKDALPKIEP